MRENFVRNCRILQRDAYHVSAGCLATLANRIRNFPGLAQSHADAAFFVTNDDKRAEIETASAFHDLCGAVDEHNLLDQLFTALRVIIDFRFGPAASTP